MITLLLFAQLAMAEEHEHWVHAALATTIIAHAADLSTTSYAMGRGGFKESNPLMRPFASDPVKLAVVKIGVAGAANYVLWRQHKKRPKLVITAALIQTVTFGYIAHRNATTLGLR